MIVNRVWQHLFGQGIVKSVDNFGVTGDKPSHPELLDHLAIRFVHEGWSIKKLVRAIVLTQTYRLGSEELPANMAVDPGAVCCGGIARAGWMPRKFATPSWP